MKIKISSAGERGLSELSGGWGWGWGVSQPFGGKTTSTGLRKLTKQERHDTERVPRGTES